MGSIAVKNLGKAYKIYPSKFKKLYEWVVPFSGKKHELKWILKDINFKIESGDSVSILGVNGAGKSTLLKLITGTSKATEGDIKVSGNVAALLELGMGFHPEFTGRENVYMSGQLLGINKNDMNELLASIEEFSGIGDYIDMPVRVYSSGMQVRLAFSVATAVRPDILIVDEALSVGDAAFQRKCFKRIQEFRDLGTTLLFVTHDLETSKRICNKAILLENGRIAAEGETKLICDLYEKKLQVNNEGNDLSPVMAHEYGNGDARIKKVHLANGQGVNKVKVREDLIFDCIVETKVSVKDLDFTLLIKTREGISLYGTRSDVEVIDYKINSSENRFIVRFSVENNFAPGDYYMNVGVMDKDTNEYYHRIFDAIIFSVCIGCEGEGKSGTGLINGACDVSVLSIRS